MSAGSVHRRRQWAESARSIVSRRQAPPGVVEEDREEGFLSGARRLTNRAFDALDEAGDWVTGKERN